MKISSCNNLNKSLYCKNNIKFKGESFEEVLNGKRLIHETAFFREPDTDEFVKEYLVENFLKKNKPVNILVGACSSGYEVYSQAMLYDEFKDKVNILGFDISEQAIEKAKKGEFIIQSGVYEEIDTCVSDDAYLADDGAITDQQKKYSKLFNNYFTQRLRKGLSDTNVHPFFLYAIGYEKRYVLNEGKGDNCTFKVGNIENLNEIADDESVHCLFFRNAMYHLACNEDMYHSTRYPKRNSKEIVKNIVLDAKKKLVNGGLFVFGENEARQGMHVSEVYDVMLECGFEPINTEHRISKLPKQGIDYPKAFYTNVWRKVG